MDPPSTYAAPYAAGTEAVRDWTADTSHIPCSMANVVMGIVGSSLGRFIGARMGKDANTDTVAGRSLLRAPRS